MEEILGIEPRIAESNSAVLPLHHISIFYRHTVPAVSFDHAKIAIYVSYVRIRLYSSAVDAIAFPTIHLMLVWSIFCIGC